ncbi:MAG: hypothetical protein ACREA9_18375 [Pyrinomonadaceae bacterium]
MLINFIGFLERMVQFYTLNVAVGAAVAGSVVGSVVSSALAPSPQGPSPSGQTDAASNLSNVQAGIAQDQYNFYKTNFQPLETKLTGEVANAGDAAEQERAAGVVHGDITNAFDAARRNNVMRANAYGLNPASGRFGAMETGLSAGEAATDSQAQNEARIQARELGFQKRFNVAQMGRNIPSQAVAGLDSAARTDLATSNLSFQQQAAERARQSSGLAPIVGPISQGVSKAVNNWFNTPSPGLPSGSNYVTDSNYGLNVQSSGDTYT